jgi:hypothetical protein
MVLDLYVFAPQLLKIIKLKTFGLEGEKSTRKEGIKLYFRFFQNIATIKIE